MENIKKGLYTWDYIGSKSNIARIRLSNGFDSDTYTYDTVGAITRQLTSEGIAVNNIFISLEIIKRLFQ